MAELEIFGDVLTTGLDDDIVVLDEYRLQQNYPNPFNPSTRIEFSLPVSAHVTLAIYNTLGQNIKTLIDEQVAAGVQTTQWDGTDENGEVVANSVYFYQLQSDFGVLKKKMMLIR